MFELTSLLTYAAALAIAVAIPGPGIAALVGQTLGNGLRASWAFLAGIALGDIVYLTIAIAGLAAVAQVFAGVFIVIKLAGGAYLLYLAVRFWTSKAGLTRVEGARKTNGLQAVMGGFAITMSNPKAIVFYLALLPSVIDLENVGIGEWAGLVVVTALVLLVVLSPYAVLASRAQQIMRRSGALVMLNRIAAAIIGAAGLVILSEAAASLARKGG